MEVKTKQKANQSFVDRIMNGHKGIRRSGIKLWFKDGKCVNIEEQHMFLG